MSLSRGFVSVSMINQARNLLLPDDNHDADGAQDDAVVDHGVGTPDRLQRLWAPYRMSYIAKGVQDSPLGDCRA